MKIKRFFAADMRQAIRKVEIELGSEAVILSSKKVLGGIEIVAALDFDPALLAKPAAAEKKIESPPVAARPNSITTGSHTLASLPSSPLLPSLQVAQAKPAASKKESIAVKTPASLAPRLDANYWSQEPTLMQIRSELNDLRGLLETQLGGLAWGDEGRRHPLRAKIIRELATLGISPALCRSLAGGIPDEMDAKLGWERALQRLGDDLVVADEDTLERGIVALVGPTGVGKTTTIAKLAARYVLRHGRKRVALVTLDNYRIGAHEQLRTYGRILDVPVYTVKNTEELTATLQDLCDKDQVLIDTAGISHRDARLHEQFTILNSARPHIKTVLVLSAATEMHGLHDIAKIFKVLSLQACVLTKLDETAQLGGALSALITHQLPLAYFTDGQRVPEDIHIARADVLLQRAVALARSVEHVGINNDESLERVFRGAVINANV